MKFCGNEVCCGSYACLNAAKDIHIDPQLFEISVSTPFGIRHFENSRYDRLLTTFCDPNRGMDEALKLWGYDAVHEKYEMATDAVYAIRRHLQIGRRLIVGPIDMGYLEYQVMPQTLRRMDHYLALERYSEAEVLCTDSEGFNGIVLEDRQLAALLSVKEVPEANGYFHIRAVAGKGSSCNTETILCYSLNSAVRNLTQAEKTGQGSTAVRHCTQYLQEENIRFWKLPLLYDVEYMVQRKSLAILLFTLLRRNHLQDGNQCEYIESLLSRQKSLLGEVYFQLRWGNRFDRSALEMFAKLESTLSLTMKKMLDGSLNFGR